MTEERLKEIEKSLRWTTIQLQNAIQNQTIGELFAHVRELRAAVTDDVDLFNFLYQQQGKGSLLNKADERRRLLQ